MTREELIKKLADEKMKENAEMVGHEAFIKNYNNWYEKCKSDAEYEVDIGVYKG